MATTPTIVNRRALRQAVLSELLSAIADEAFQVQDLINWTDTGAGTYFNDYYAAHDGQFPLLAALLADPLAEFARVRDSLGVDNSIGSLDDHVFRDAMGIPRADSEVAVNPRETMKRILVRLALWNGTFVLGGEDCK